MEARIERSLERCLEWSQQGRHRKVLTEVERLLGLLHDEPHLSAELLIWKAQALLSMGCADRALPAASTSWKIECSPHACHLMAAGLHALGDSDQAEELLRMGHELFPDAAHLPMQLAMMMADQGRIPEALDVLDEVSPTARLPEDLHVFLVGLRANLLATIGRFTEAERVLEEGLGRHPGSSLLLEAHDSIHRARSRRQAESDLLASWEETLESLEGVAGEVDEAILRTASALELEDLAVVATRRLWRAYVRHTSVRPQSPEPWGAGLVVAAMELDGRRPSLAAVARALRVNPSTVRTVVTRLRRFVDSLELEFARRAFGAFSNPRLDHLCLPTAGSTEPPKVVRFPSP